MLLIYWMVREIDLKTYIVAVLFVLGSPYG